MTAPVVADTAVWSNFAHAGDPRLARHAKRGEYIHPPDPDSWALPPGGKSRRSQ